LVPTHALATIRQRSCFPARRRRRRRRSSRRIHAPTQRRHGWRCGQALACDPGACRARTVRGRRARMLGLAERAVWRRISSSWRDRLFRAGCDAPRPDPSEPRSHALWLSERHSSTASRTSARSAGSSIGRRARRGCRGCVASGRPRRCRLLGAVVVEGVDPRVLEETPDDRDRADVLWRSRAGPGAGSRVAADVEVDAHPGVRREVQRLDTGAIDEELILSVIRAGDAGEWAEIAWAISPRIALRRYAGRDQHLAVADGRPNPVR